jgi:ABC-2 type transport system ATP-binding protein
VGYLPSTPQFDDRATGRAVLDLHAAVAGAPRREELLALFDVPLDRRVRSYSTGQRQQLGLVRTFAHDPDLAIMDEPTAGLDPLVQARFESFVRAERRAGTTVLLSSHVLGEVRRLCDRVAVIRDGRIVAVEDVEALVDRSGKLVRVRVAGDLDPAALSLSGVHDRSTRTVEHAGAPDSTDDPEAPGDATAPDGPDADRVTELSFTYTGDVDALVDALADYHLLDLDVEEAPLERVFARFYDDGERDPLEESERVDATPAGAGRGRAPGQREERQ